MKMLKFDLNVPFWCSFTEYGTMNIQQTYLFPPPPTIFGMLLNALGKPAAHTITDDYAKQRLIEEYLDDYSKAPPKNNLSKSTPLMHTGISW